MRTGSVLVKVSLGTSLTTGEEQKMSQVNQEHPVTPGREKLARPMGLRDPYRKLMSQGWGESRR